MSHEIKESDWKLLRQMVPVALERFCQRILGELDRIGSESTKSHHQRYLDIFEVLQRRDREIAQAFNDMRRSTALTQLAAICSQGLLTGEDVIALVAETEATLLGFVMGVITTAPPVYNPGGLVCIVDDFAVGNPTEWGSVGAALLAAVEQEAKARGAVLSVVVCAQQDQVKRTMLREAGLTVASEWQVKPL